MVKLSSTTAATTTRMLCSALRQRHQLITCGLWRVCVCVACRQQKRGMRRGGVELWMVPEAGQPASQPASQGVVRVHIAGFGGDVSGQRVRLPYYPTFCLLVLFPASQPRRVVQLHARIGSGGEEVGDENTLCYHPPYLVFLVLWRVLVHRYCPPRDL